MRLHCYASQHKRQRLQKEECQNKEYGGCRGNGEKSSGENPGRLLFFVGIPKKARFHAIGQNYLQECHPGIEICQHTYIRDLWQGKCPIEREQPAEQFRQNTTYAIKEGLFRQCFHSSCHVYPNKLED